LVTQPRRKFMLAAPIVYGAVDKPVADAIKGVAVEVAPAAVKGATVGVVPAAAAVEGAAVGVVPAAAAVEDAAVRIVPAAAAVEGAATGFEDKVERVLGIVPLMHQKGLNGGKFRYYGRDCMNDFGKSPFDAFGRGRKLGTC